MAARRAPAWVSVACALSLAAALQGCGQAPDPARGAAVLDVEPPSVALGDLRPGVPATVRVVVRNRSDRPLEVRAAVPSCPCVRASIPAAPLPPGGSAECVVTLDPPAVDADESVMKTVAFVADRGDPASVTLQGIVRAVPGAPRAASP